MSVWSYCAPLGRFLSIADFFVVYFVTLFGRCAVLSLPALGLVRLLRRTLLRDRLYARGAVWAAMAPVLFLGKLRVFYKSRLFAPLILWQSLCSGYGWVRYGYLVGMAAAAAGLLRRRSRLRRLLRGLPREAASCGQVSLCDAPVSPFASGLLFPRVVLPKLIWERLDREELAVILLHERTHIRRGHLWYFFLWDILCALLWVNPLLRPAGRELREDMELICDHAVIRRTGGDALAYGRTILKSLALVQADLSDSPAAFAGKTDFEEVRERLRRVRDYRPASRPAALLPGICAAAGALLAITAFQAASLPRYTELGGFSVVHVGVIHVGEDLFFSTLYETDKAEAFPPIQLRGEWAEVDIPALRALLPEDAPEDGWYYIFWGGFLKVPGIGGALNSICLCGLEEAAPVVVEFQDVNRLFYVKLAKWV